MILYICLITVDDIRYERFLVDGLIMLKQSSLKADSLIGENFTGYNGVILSIMLVVLEADSLNFVMMLILA